MSIIDAPKSLASTRPGFADERDVTLFVDTLERFEKGEIDPDAWRSFRLVHGVYSQRQDEQMMVRVKIPQGVLTAAQLEALADVAERWSNGKGHVTTRQNVQFHFVKPGHTDDVLRRCAEAGLTTREACGNSVRNITTCPYAGTSAVEPFDPTPYAEALTRHLLRGPLSSTLPRKFKIAFGGCCGTDCVHAAINDLGFLVRVEGERPGFRLTIGGGTAVLPRSGFVAHEFLPAEEVLEAAEAVVRVFHRIGDREDRSRARLKYVIERIGRDAFLKEYEREREAIRAEGGRPLILDVGEDRDASSGRVPTSLLQDWPPRGHDMYRDQRPTAANHRSVPAPTGSLAILAPSGSSLRQPSFDPQSAIRSVPAPANSVSVVSVDPKLETRESKPDSAPVRDSALPRSSFPPQPGHTEFARTSIRPQKQPGFSTATVRLPLGDLTTSQFRALAALSKKYGEGEVRLTHEQNAVLRYVPTSQLPAFCVELDAAGLAKPGAGTLVDVTSCPGAATCRIAVTASRGLASLLGDFLERRPDLTAKAPSLHLKISGCPNGCGQHHIAGIGFQGGVRRFGKTVIPQYHLFLGGGVNAEGATFGRLAARIPARRVPAALERLIELYAAEHVGDEGPERFFAHLPLTRAATLLADLEDMGPADVSAEDLIDLGEEKAYAVQVSAGECAV